MPHLPSLAEVTADSSGTGFFLCTRKDKRTGRTGPFLVVTLQDVSGEMQGKVFQDAEQHDEQFDAGEFVAVQGRGNFFNQRLEIIVDKIRRVIPGDEERGFRQENCILCSSRPIDEMWTELTGRIASVEDGMLRDLLSRIVTHNEERLRVWPAARQVHHAYRSGLLEHVLKIMDVAVFLAEQYEARTDLVIAGALLHDIGKLEELSYDVAANYSVVGNLVGHISIGVGMLRDAVRDTPDFPRDLEIELEHLILSHHGAKEMGSPVEPKTLEAFILAAADDLDAKLHQVRGHLANDQTDGPFTSFHRYLERALYKRPT